MTEQYQDVRECRVIAVPGALASAGITYPFPGVDYFKLLSVAFTLTTAAAGAARQVLVRLVDSTGADVFAAAAPATQAGGLAVVYSFSSNTTSFGSGALGHIGAPFLEARIPQNLTLKVTVTGTSGTDAISNARILVEQAKRVHPDG